MKIAIMQPYFLPYIGYFQLVNAVDEFVVYDNIEYTKKGWINRNRILVNGTERYISLPLKKASDFFDVRDRYLADSWIQERGRLLNRIYAVYKKAPCFKIVYPLIEKIILHEDKNLFRFIINSLYIVNSYLQIYTPMTISSTLNINHELKAQKKVIQICKTMNAKNYINPIGGLSLYKNKDFLEEGLSLFFINSNNIVYQQYDNDFVPNLSIIDVMMFNDVESIKIMLDEYKLITN